jgi:hypothetical protein
MFPDQPGQYPDQPYGHYEPVADDQPVPPVDRPYLPYLPQQPYQQPVSPGPYPPAHYPQPQIVVNAPQAPPASVWATIGLILSIIGFLGMCCTFGTLSGAAVVCAFIGMAETKDGTKSGRTMAIAALTIGLIGVIPGIFLTVSTITGGISGQIHPTPTP